MERPRGRLGTGVDAASTAGTAMNFAAVTTSGAAAVRDVRSVAGKVVARGRAARGSPAVGKAAAIATRAARAADSRAGVIASRTLNAVAANPVMQVAARASVPLLAFRTGMNVASGYNADGVRGAVRGAIHTVDPTGLATMFMSDRRTLLERGFDAMFGRAPALPSPSAGAYLNPKAEARTGSNEKRAAAEREASKGTPTAAAVGPRGGPVEVKPYKRADGTQVAGYSVTRKSFV